MSVCRRFGEETYHVSVSQRAPNPPGLMETMEAAPPAPPVTLAMAAMDPASPVRPRVASAAPNQGGQGCPNLDGFGS